jgi:hypothetical protein
MTRKNRDMNRNDIIIRRRRTTNKKMVGGSLKTSKSSAKKDCHKLTELLKSVKISRDQFREKRDSQFVKITDLREENKFLTEEKNYMLREKKTMNEQILRLKSEIRTLIRENELLMQQQIRRSEESSHNNGARNEGMLPSNMASVMRKLNNK